MFMKVLLCMVIAGLTLYTFQPQQSVIPTKADIPTITVPSAKIIDEAAVIKSIKTQGILSTLKVATSKEYSYEDPYKMTIETLTQRKFKLKFDAVTYLGIDTSQVMVIIESNTVFVYLPAPILLSTENSNIEFINDVGLFRRSLSDADKLYLLSKATESVKKEAMSYENKQKATVQARKVITGLLKQIPNIKSLDVI